VTTQRDDAPKAAPWNWALPAVLSGSRRSSQNQDFFQFLNMEY
jgi:hypothetical protein